MGRNPLDPLRGSLGALGLPGAFRSVWKLNGLSWANVGRIPAFFDVVPLLSSGARQQVLRVHLALRCPRLVSANVLEGPFVGLGRRPTDFDKRLFKARKVLLDVRVVGVAEVEAPRFEGIVVEREVPPDDAGDMRFDVQRNVERPDAFLHRFGALLVPGSTDDFLHGNVCTTYARARASPRRRFLEGSRTPASMGTMRYEHKTSWRDYYNPLRGLTLERIVSLEEQSDRGDHASLQWLWDYMGRTDVTVRSAVEKRTCGVESLDWQICKIPTADEVLADEQAEVLRTCYDSIDNLVDVSKRLVLAKFTGYQIFEREPFRPDVPLLKRLIPIDPVYFNYDREKKVWLFNETGDPGTLRGEEVNPADVLIYNPGAPIYRPICRAFFSKQLSLADWDCALENGANPAVFVVMPEGTTEEQQAKYQSMAENVTSNMRGALPFGSSVTLTDLGQRQKMPFFDRIQYSDQQIVMAATGGLLTMLTESGSGTLAGNAHEETLRQLYKSDAADLSEVFQQQLDKPVLQHYFPGQPIAAYFRYDLPQKEPTLKELTDVISALSWIQLRIPSDVLSEKLGFMLEPIPQNTQEGAQ